MVTVEQPKEKREKIEKVKQKMAELDEKAKNFPNDNIVFLVDISEGKRELDTFEQEAKLPETVIQDVVITPYAVSPAAEKTKVKNLRTGEVSFLNETDLTQNARVAASFTADDGYGYDDDSIYRVNETTVDITSIWRKEKVETEIREDLDPDAYYKAASDVTKRTYTTSGLAYFVASHCTERTQVNNMDGIEKDMSAETAIQFANKAETTVAEYYGNKQAEYDLRLLKIAQDRKVKTSTKPKTPVF